MQFLYGRYNAEVLQFYDDANSEYDVAVVKLLYRSFPGNPHKMKVRFHRKQVLIRDGFKCAYCSNEKKTDLTIDHVLPKSRGGPTSYTNCVTACRACNQFKGDRTPDEARMRLERHPVAPLRGVIVNILEMPPEWSNYIRSAT
jgi:hypothetical protein